MNFTPEALLGLRARNLSRRYGRHNALQALDLDLRPGEILGLLGPNGAGKSTAMRILAGNLAPDTGRIEICGVDLFEQPEAAKVHLGYLPEIPPLYPELTVSEFLYFAARLRRVSKADLDAAVKLVLQRCALLEVAHKLIAGLSKGYRQRVGIAQAIVHAPAVIILDEPTAGLDPLHMREIRSLIRELGESHSVLLSTHILAEAETLCDRALILRQGRAVFNGSMEDLLGGRAGGMEEIFAELMRQEEPA